MSAKLANTMKDQPVPRGDAHELFEAMRRVVAAAPEPCQECGKHFKPSQLTSSGHCPSCSQLYLDLDDETTN